MSTARETAGWILVGIGLVMFWSVYALANSGKVFTAGEMVIAGIVVFRGGIHLLKVAIAARVCELAQDRLYPPTVTTGRPVITASHAGRAIPMLRQPTVWR